MGLNAAAHKLSLKCRPNAGSRAGSSPFVLREQSNLTILPSEFERHREPRAGDVDHDAYHSASPRSRPNHCKMGQADSGSFHLAEGANEWPVPFDTQELSSSKSSL